MANATTGAILMATAAILATSAVKPATAQTADPTTLSAIEAAAAIRSGKLTSRALVDALLMRAEARKGLNAFITLDAAKARAEADKADADRAAGKGGGALQGVPIVVKDNINAAGWPTTAGTPGLEGYSAKDNAPVLQKLIDAGAIVLGKANMHELAFGITSNNAAFGAVGNARAPDRFAGGSSGGSAAAIAADIAPAGLGTDTGGSVRVPAALNGIFGLRPSMGRYPQAGIVPIAHTRDTPGPMARTLADVTLMDMLVTGDDATPVVTLATLRIGVPKPFVDDLDPETAKLLSKALDAMKAAGVTIVPVDASEIANLNEKVGFPVVFYEVKRELDSFVKTYGAASDVNAVAAKIASPDVKFVFDNLVLGDKATPEAAYKDAHDVQRPKLIAAYGKLFADNRLDALVFPTTPLPTQPIKGSDETVMLNGKQVPTFGTFIRNTDPGSNAGLPGLSVPIGDTAQGLPVGMGLDGLSGSDRRLLSIAATLQPIIGVAR